MHESVDDFINRLTEVERDDLLEGLRLRNLQDVRSMARPVASLLQVYLQQLGLTEDARAVDAIYKRLT